MISRLHGLILSLLLGSAAATGAYAMIGTANLSDSETKPEVLSSRQIAKRAHKLDAWEASLAKALRANPSKLAPLNEYATVMFVSGPGAASLPTVATPPAGAKQQAPPPARRVAETEPKQEPVVAASDRAADTERNAAPVAVAEPQQIAPAPAPALVAAVPTVAPSEPAKEAEDDDDHESPTSSSAAPQTLSVEQQCRLLERAAEDKGERAKQDAERQCEALKQAAEKRG